MTTVAGGRGSLIGVAWSLAFLVTAVVQCRGGPSGQPRQVGETVFDITKFGAKGDGKTDNAMAVIAAWNAACQYRGRSKVLIPRGQFVAAVVLLNGPCNATKPITVEIQGTLLAVEDISEYANGAWIIVQRFDGLVLTGGGTLNARGQQVWQYSTGADSDFPSPVMQNAEMNNLNFLNSMGFHVKVTDSNNITISRLKIDAPANSPNTDGIHLSSSVNVNITDSIIGTGDDCISIGHGTINILVARITCGPGHGISIGSLGKRPQETSLKGITIINCTMIGTTNGARIKTYHASPQIQASAIYFQDILMNQVKNPIIIDQHYNSKKIPQQSKVQLVDVHYRNIWGTTVSAIPINLNCSSIFPCQNVELSNINLTPVGSIGPLKTTCSNAKIFIKGAVNPPALARCA